MIKNRVIKRGWLVVLAVLVVSSICLYCFVPRVRLQTELMMVWVRGAVDPAGELPTPISTKGRLFTVPVNNPEGLVSEDNRKIETVEPRDTQEVLPSSFVIPPPAFDPHRDYQDWNNCGPATLALALRMWQWQGDQFEISAVIKPNRQDKNVNIDELAAYVNETVEGLQAEVRVGGDQLILKKLIAAGFAVVIEESFTVEKTAWPGDDLWAAHYLLLTGYDDSSQTYTVQDSYYGPDRQTAYADIESDWQSFNHVYLLVFPKDRQQEVQSILGADWVVSDNVARTLKSLQSQIQLGQANEFTWFNLGTNYVAVKEYAAAAAAFQNARQLGLPQRMLRYQFGPFTAYYETGSLKDLTQLVDYALKITPDSEEALLWKGWAYSLSGDQEGAATFFRKSLEANPGNQDAKNALEEIYR